jgi:hypothetical protein
MGWNGSGTHNRIHNFSADASAGIQAQAVRFDAEFDDISTALENCQTLDGQTTPTANSPMGGFKHTGVAAATSTDNYLRADQHSQQVGIFVRDVNAGVTGKMTASASPFPTAFTEGQRVTVKVSANGSAAAPRAIVINGLSANVVDNSGSAIPASYMFKDGYFDLVYDASASAFRMLNTSIPAGAVKLTDTGGNFTGNEVETALSELGPEKRRHITVLKKTPEYRLDAASTTALADDASLSMTFSVGATYRIKGQVKVQYNGAGTSADGIQYRFAQDGDGINGHYTTIAIPFGVTASTSAGDLVRFEARAWDDTVSVAVGAVPAVVNIDGIWAVSATSQANFSISWDPITSAGVGVGLTNYSFFQADKL